MAEDWESFTSEDRIVIASIADLFQLPEWKVEQFFYSTEYKELGFSLFLDKDQKNIQAVFHCLKSVERLAEIAIHLCGCKLPPEIAILSDKRIKVCLSESYDAFLSSIKIELSGHFEYIWIDGGGSCFECEAENSDDKKCEETVMIWGSRSLADSIHSLVLSRIPSSYSGLSIDSDVRNLSIRYCGRFGELDGNGLRKLEELEFICHGNLNDSLCFF